MAGVEELRNRNTKFELCAEEKKSRSLPAFKKNKVGSKLHVMLDWLSVVLIQSLAHNEKG
jgi:hypothetical protein